MWEARSTANSRYGTDVGWSDVVLVHDDGGRPSVGGVVDLVRAPTLDCLAAQHADDLGAAEAAARRALAAMRATACRQGLPVVAGWLLELCAATGELGRAERELANDGLGAQLAHSVTSVPALYGRARVRLAQRRFADALADLQAIAALERDHGLGGQRYPWRSPAARALGGLGRGGEAAELIAAELERAVALGAGRAHGVALRVAAELAPDANAFRHAIRVLQRSGSRAELAGAYIDLGATLRRAGLRRVAAGPLGQGLELARGCGARAEAARAEAELAAGRPRRRSVLLSGVASLTPSERRVCALAAQGLSNAAIAGALVVTRKTVETHLGHAYSKLGIRGRNELIAALGDAIASPEGRTS